MGWAKTLSRLAQDINKRHKTKNQNIKVIEHKWSTDRQNGNQEPYLYHGKTREDERLTINSLLQHFVNVWADFAK